jgi:S-adenosyl methyltransferase
VRRAVRYLVNEVGIRQLIDIGTGLPTMGNVHEVAMAANPAARVVYVDHDPIVLAHARNMLQGTPSAVIIGHDMRAPAARVYDAATTRMFVRSREEVLALVRGLDVVAPGLVWTPEWRPEPGEQVLARPSGCYYYALVARKP